MTPEQQLRDVALRVTGPRVAVLTEVHAHPHADVDTLTAKVRARLGSVSTQAVYDVLRALTDAELVRRIESAVPRPLRSPRRRQPPPRRMPHVRRVADIDCATGSAPCLEASNTNGFVIDEAEVTYWGICPACQQHPPQPPSRTTSIQNTHVETKENPDRTERFDVEQRCTGRQRSQLPHCGGQRPDPVARCAFPGADGPLQPRTGA